MKQTDYVERFDKVPLFEGLAPLEIAQLLRITEDVSARKGDFVVRQGTQGDGFYVIGAGKFEVLKTGKKEEVLARLEQLSSFGEMSLVTDEPRSASILCIEDGRLKKFPKTRFRDLLDEGSLPAFKVVRNMCRLLARRLAALDDKLVQ
jgi:CRP-like cAMP-binding protein